MAVDEAGDRIAPDVLRFLGEGPPVPAPTTDNSV